MPVTPPPPAAGIAAAKAELRQTLRAARLAHAQALDPRHGALLFRRPPAAIAARVPAGATIGAYCAMPGEAPALGWARWLFEAGHPVALPWFAARRAPMRFRLWRSPWLEEALEPGPHGIPQPAASEPEVTPGALIVPLVGFTAARDRLGQGAGHYDRWIADHPGTVTIGLAWDCQETPSLPLEPHDRRLDAIVTPTRLLAAAP